MAQDTLAAADGGGSNDAPPVPPSPEGPKSFGRRALDLAKRAAPNVLTAGNLVSGVFASILAAQGALVGAVMFILLANVFDAFDGRVARALKVASPMGIASDSLADVVSFGVAPAILVASGILAPLGGLGLGIGVVFAAAGAYRLARFTLGAYAAHFGAVPHKKEDSFMGLPIPGGAGVVAALTLAMPTLVGVMGLAAFPFAAALTLATAWAMASKLPYPAFKKAGGRTFALLGLAAAAVIGSLALSGASMLIPAALFGAYLLSGPIIGLWKGSEGSAFRRDEAKRAAFQRELKRKAFHQTMITLSLVPFFLLSPAHVLIAAPVAVGLIGLVETLRLKAPWAKPFFDKVFGGIIRDKEQNRYSGSFWAAVGAATVMFAATLLHASPAFVVAAVLALAFGDSASPLVGLRFGHGKYKVAGTQRSVDGTVAGFLVAVGIALFCGFSPLVALAAAAVFSAVDVYPVKPDDNLWIPIAFSTALFVFSHLF